MSAPSVVTRKMKMLVPAMHRIDDDANRWPFALETAMKQRIHILRGLLGQLDPTARIIACDYRADELDGRPYARCDVTFECSFGKISSDQVSRPVDPLQAGHDGGCGDDAHPAAATSWQSTPAEIAAFEMMVRHDQGGASQC